MISKKEGKYRQKIAKNWEMQSKRIPNNWELLSETDMKIKCVNFKNL